ncbi:glyoxylase-like metal-dependent hydrolase (beta-lactamase superfamily II) [Desulfitispora alkaliphila]|uniref:MBL fold metallo-hydrolase n=1 Tax=Desulfitispora alkaliphila TaxID=622674 RepID=UPI003D1F7C23
MITEVLASIFKIVVPLPNNPLKELNCYVIKGEERNLMIDTGMNREECLTALQKGVNELQLSLDQTDFFITHMHADHSGLVPHLATATSKVYSHQPDANIINGNMNWQDMLDYAKKSGMPKKVLQNALEKHPGYKYRAKDKLDFTFLKDGQVLRIGPYSLKCIVTPGHTQGHMCLYEPKKKILFSGDHILGKITPNISLWTDHGNPLKDYLENLEKINQYPIELVLPGHRELMSNCSKRIKQLKEHHYKRLAEIVEILHKGAEDAYQIASQVKWDMTYKSWDEFPVPQKWFATGEVNAHLRYLLDEGKIKREFKQGMFIFSL